MDQERKQKDEVCSAICNLEPWCTLMNEVKDLIATANKADNILTNLENIVLKDKFLNLKKTFAGDAPEINAELLGDCITLIEAVEVEFKNVPKVCLSSEIKELNGNSLFFLRGVVQALSEYVRSVLLFVVLL